VVRLAEPSGVERTATASGGTSIAGASLGACGLLSGGLSRSLLAHGAPDGAIPGRGGRAGGDDSGGTVPGGLSAFRLRQPVHQAAPDVLRVQSDFINPHFPINEAVSTMFHEMPAGRRGLP
jgi:hypothetical protein